MEKRLPLVWQGIRMQKVKNFLKKLNENPIPLCIVTAILLVFVIEVLHRHSFAEACAFVAASPLQYLINVVLLQAMLMLCLLAKKRLFWAFLIALIWFILGVANCIVLLNRVSPLSWSDVSMLTSVVSIFKQYLTVFQIILAVAGLIFCVLLSVWLYDRVPKVNRRAHWRRDLIAFLLFVGGGFGMVVGTANLLNLFENTGNITLTFDRSGFVYSFANSVVDTGIMRPITYSETVIDNAYSSLQDYDAEAFQETDKKPNIIFVQLESFFDLDNMRYYFFSEDPTPNFHALLKDYTSGLLTVPTVGAGTVNTEFEVLTGMSLKFFGLCEYPYKTILMEQTCESLAYNLQEQGYSTAVIHNNRGTFYDRHKVFGQLGFDIFDSVEYMRGLEYNPIDFAKDKVLTGEIIDRMKQTEGNDFIYTITVQSHGKYPAEKIDDTQTITLQGEKDEGRRNQFEYFASQCKEVDEFIGDLISEVNKFGEDTVIVFFGDHLPTLGIEDSELQFQNTYQTTYIIWDNIGLEQKDENLAAYQLSSKVLSKLGYSNGILTKYHQLYKDAVNYLPYLGMLEYDMLYGEHYVYGGVDRYEPSNLQFGFYEITIDNVRQGNNVVVVTGQHFTEASHVYVNGKRKDTEFVSENALLVRDFELEEGDRIRIRQVTSTGGAMGDTESYIYLGE